MVADKIRDEGYRPKRANPITKLDTPEERKQFVSDSISEIQKQAEYITRVANALDEAGEDITLPSIRKTIDEVEIPHGWRKLVEDYLTDTFAKTAFPKLQMQSIQSEESSRQR